MSCVREGGEGEGWDPPKGKVSFVRYTISCETDDFAITRPFHFYPSYASYHESFIVLIGNPECKNKKIGIGLVDGVLHLYLFARCTHKFVTLTTTPKRKRSEVVPFVFFF
jgi:hypothetical protein